MVQANIDLQPSHWLLSLQVFLSHYSVKDTEQHRGKLKVQRAYLVCMVLGLAVLGQVRFLLAKRPEALEAGEY